MTVPDRMVAWLREAMDAAEQIARRHRHACGDWEYDHIGGEIRDHGNGGTVVYVGRDNPVGEHFARHDPTAVLRRIAADRQLLDLHADDGYSECKTCAVPDGTVEVNGIEYEMLAHAPAPCGTVRLLAEGWGWEETT